MNKKVIAITAVLSMATMMLEFFVLPFITSRKEACISRF